MTPKDDGDTSHQRWDNIIRTSSGRKVKRAAERGLLPFLDDPEALKAELLRRITERAKRR